MIYLLLSVLFSTGLFVIFKYFGIYKVDVLKAIVVNYIVACSLGFLSTTITIPISEILEKPWFLGALCLGGLFVAVFFVMAMTAQKNGVSVTSIAGKMSVVIPIVFGVFLYNESVTFIKVTGIIIALLAVYLASVKEKKASYLDPESSSGKINAGLLFPILLFFGSGTIDTVLKYIEVSFVKPDEIALFSGSLFGIAGCFGIGILLIKFFIKKTAFGFKNIIAGIVLGVPNYYSIIFLIKALQVEGLESSVLFTINNVAIVITSVLVGLLLFKEEFSNKNKLGIGLAIVGIVLVSLS